MPPTAAFSVKTAPVFSEILAADDTILDDAANEVNRDQITLALTLLFEMSLPASPWMPLLRMMPKQLPEFPLFWSKQDRAESQNERFTAQVANMESKLDNIHRWRAPLRAQCCPVLLSPRTLPRSAAQCYSVSQLVNC